VRRVPSTVSEASVNRLKTTKMKLSQKGQIIINSYIANTGLGFATILPILVGAIVDENGFDREMIGWISAINISGMVVGGIIATLLIGKFRLVKVLQVALLGLILFDAVSIFATNPELMLSVRFLSGVFGGLIYASSLAIFSGLENPIKAFGVYVLVYCGWAMIIFIALPYMMISGGSSIAFLTLVFMSTISFIGLFFIQDLEREIEPKEAIRLQDLLNNKAILIGLFAYFAMTMGGGTVWTYCERIGKAAGLSTSFIGWGLSISSLAALLGGFLVMRIGTKKGLKVPLLGGSLVMILGVLMLWYGEYAWVYLLSLSVIGAAWSFLIPFFQQIQTQFDPSGKVVSLGTIVNMAGRATGPALGAMLLGDSPFINVIWIGSTSLVLSMLAIWWLLKKY
jgi:predicted MFS family arabinose efflux permease